ncbi:uncharacterized protein METZ01_LOCUS494751, partial [marine metagenome]
KICFGMLRPVSNSRTYSSCTSVGQSYPYRKSKHSRQSSTKV